MLAQEIPSHQEEPGIAFDTHIKHKAEVCDEESCLSASVEVRSNERIRCRIVCCERQDFPSLASAFCRSSITARPGDGRGRSEPRAKNNRLSHRVWRPLFCGNHIASRVWEFRSNSRLGWFGDGKDVHAYHTFLLNKTHEGCHIVTEEVVEGPGAIQFREQQPNAMHEGRQLC
jgi:hypothetical protein